MPLATCTRYDDQCSYADGHDQRATPSKHQILALQERVRLLEKQLSLRDDNGDQWPVGEGDVDQDQQSEPAAASRNSLKVCPTYSNALSTISLADTAD